ncbi:MAG: transcriptional repressor [Bacteroidales bacterium]
MDFIKIRNTLTMHGLKITPQRTAILEAFDEMRDHPSADIIIEYIRQHHPNIATGTVYNTLETFVDKGIIQKVKTENGVMRYDFITEKHHHLYDDSNIIKDYFDEELNEILQDYFKNKTIPGFEIEDIKLQIKGKFNNV